MYFLKTAVLGFASVALAADHKVLVGQNNGLTFTPQTINAAVGDTVTYQFLTQNHTVTSGNPNQGCTPDGRFNSGFVPIAAGGNAAATAKGAGAGGKGKANTKGKIAIRGADNVFVPRQNTNPPTFTVQVTDNNPVTVYCAQAQHCQVGMVMVINPANSGAQTLKAYSQKCAAAKQNQVPNTRAGTGGKLQGVRKAAGKTKGKKAAGAAGAAGAGGAAPAKQAGGN